jgi:hypothetical protein
MTIETQTIQVRVTQAQQTGLELELETLFGMKVDDVLDVGQNGEKTLVYEVASDTVGSIVALLETKKAAGAIVDVTVDTTLSSGEQVRRARRAQTHLEKELLFFELGEHLEVMQDALQEYIERRVVRPRTGPLSPAAMRASVLRGEYVSGVVAIDLGDIIDHDLEWFLDELSRLLTGSELLMNHTYPVVGSDGESLWLKVEGDASMVVEYLDEDELGCQILAYFQELVVFTEEEARAIRDASELDPWEDLDASEAVGHGYVLAARHTEQPDEDVVIPAGVTGVRRVGLWIDGTLTDVLHHFESRLGEHRTWRAWPNCDLALVVADSAFPNPMDDPLLIQLAQAMGMAVVVTTEDLKLSFVDLCEGYLIACNEQGWYETWEILPDGRGFDASLTERAPALTYEGDLYSYGNSYQTRELAEAAIEREVGK